MRIAFFSPLPPLRTALADHSAGLLPHLKVGADLDLFIDEGYRPTGDLVDRFDVYSYKEFERRASEYDVAVYVMGNDARFHGYFSDVMRAHPGVTLLHDTALQHYFFVDAGQHGDMARYQSALERAYGPTVAHRIVGRALTGQLDRVHDLYPLLEPVVDASLGVVVYNEFARRTTLRRRPHARVRRLKYHFYLPTGFPDAVDVPRLRARWGLGDAFVVGSFGLLHPEKRLDVCLRAFARLRRRRPDARYLLVGEGVPSYDVAGLIASQGLTESVVFTGWLDALAFTEHLCAADVAVHLRHPHVGGTLYTPLRLLGLGRPTVLSDIEPTEEFPEGCCVKIRPDDDEEEVLFEALTYLAEHPEFRRNLGANARDFIRRHYDVARIAEDHLDFFAHIAAAADSTRRQHTRRRADENVTPGTAAPGLDEAAAILQQLERNARERHSRDELGHGEHLLNAFEQMRLTSWVNSHQPIAWPHWPKGVWAKAGALAQKVTRRLLAWYVAPIVEEQNQFNAAVERAFRALMDENTRLRTELQALADDQPKRPER
ncbi:MAG TPA: glycosyltransferase [Candidatus Acidoferrum sp.]|nr:glycosyltransferase [Candidatus Acidoferrum sp.]